MERSWFRKEEDCPWVINLVEQVLAPGGEAERQGFRGLRRKVVVDAGTRDALFVPVYRRLGARDVWGIDPDQVTLQEAVRAGRLPQDRAVPARMQDVEMGRKADVATVLNFFPPPLERKPFLRAVYDNLRADGGQAVVTVAEYQIAVETTNELKHLFGRGNVQGGYSVRDRHGETEEVSRSHRSVGVGANGPHKYLLVATKREARSRDRGRISGYFHKVMQYLFR